MHFSTISEFISADDLLQLMQEVQFPQNQECINYVYEDKETQTRTIYPINLRLDGNKIADKKGNTWLHIAAMTGNQQMLLSFLQKGGPKLDLEVRNGNDETPLMVATEARRLETVYCLIENKADINAMRRNTGWSVLHSAALAGGTTLVEFLLQKGARITIASWDPYFSKFCQGTPLIAALQTGNEKLIRILIAAGDDPHQVLKDGTNVLHYTVNDPAICKLFLTEFKVNPNQKSVNGATALPYVKTIDLLACFLKHGADIDSVDEEGDTLLWKHCALEGDPDMLIFLLDNKADLNHKSYKKNSEEWGDTCLPLKRFMKTLCPTNFRVKSSDEGTYEMRKILPSKVVEVIKKFMQTGQLDWKDKISLKAQISNYMINCRASGAEGNALKNFHDDLSYCTIL